MRFLSPNDPGPVDRLIYRRRVGSLFAVYGALLMLATAYVAYQANGPADRSEALNEQPPIRQAVKYD